VSKPLWGPFQLAIVGLWIWILADTPDPDKPPPGAAILQGWITAFVFTIIPIAIIEGVKDVRRL